MLVYEVLYCIFSVRTFWCMKYYAAFSGSGHTGIWSIAFSVSGHTCMWSIILHIQGQDALVYEVLYCIFRVRTHWCMKYYTAFSVSGHAGSVWQLPVHAAVHRGVCEATATHWHPHIDLPCSSGCRLLPLTHAVCPQHSRESRTSLLCNFSHLMHRPSAAFIWVMHMFVLLTSVLHTDHPQHSCESCTCLFCCLQSYTQTIHSIHVSHVLCTVTFCLSYAQTTHRYFFVL